MIRRLGGLFLALSGTVTLVAGIAWVYAPAGLIAAGIAAVVWAFVIGSEPAADEDEEP